VLDRLDCSSEIGGLSDVDFVIENVIEDWEIKRQVHEQIDRTVPLASPIAANTSAIPITRIASVSRRPERVIGMHFMNPAPLMPTVELIRGLRTSEETVAAARRLVEQAGRQAIVVNDSPGFVTNRVMMLMVNEAMFLVQEGVASVEDVDRLFKTCFGH
jgi:3-hydroxybutyryl-CoA dehydrogenase